MKLEINRVLLENVQRFFMRQVYYFCQLDNNHGYLQRLEYFKPESTLVSYSDLFTMAWLLYIISCMDISVYLKITSYLVIIQWPMPAHHDQVDDHSYSYASASGTRKYK